MIDSIMLWVPSELIEDIDIMAELPLKITNISTTYNDQNKQYSVTGYLGSLSVRLWETGISISESLSKYYTGNNMHTLSFRENRDALRRIGEQLGFPIEIARVTRFDVAENFIVDYPIANYFKYFGDMPFFTRSQLNDGLYYKGSNKVITFYDKVKERKVKKEAVLDCYLGKNVLRYELRFKGRNGKQFDKQHVLVSDLMDISFFKEVLRLYIDLYKKIYKHQSVLHYTDLQLNDRARFLNQIKLCGIQSLGGEALLIQAINQARKDKVFKNPMHATRIIQDIKKTYEVSPYTAKNEMMEELTGKVLEIVNDYMNCNFLL